MRDIFDDYIDNNFRLGEAVAAVVATGIITKGIDAAGISRDIGAFDWFITIAALLWLGYFSAGRIHDCFRAFRERHYITVPGGRNDEEIA